MEQEYRLWVENANTVILKCNRNGRLTFINKFGEKLFGYSKEELIGKHVVGTIVPETESRGGKDLTHIVDDIFNNPQAYEHFENENLCKDGSRVWIAWTNTIFNHEDTETTEMLSIGTDISAQHKIEKKLQERVKELKCLYGISSLIEKANSNIESILRGTADLIPPSWQYPEITCVQVKLDSQVYKTDNFTETKWLQSQEIIVSGKKVGVIEVYYLEDKPEVDEGPFLTEERDLINAIAERLGHIIDKKQSDEELLVMKTLLEQTSDVIAIKDKNFQYTLANPVCLDELKRLSGKKQIIGKSDYQLLPNNLADNIREIDERILRNDEVVAVEEIVGKKTYFSRKFPIKNTENNTIAIGLIASNITKQKQVENDLQKSELRYRTIMEVSLQGIYQVDANGYITFANPLVSELTGYPIEELDGLSLDILFPPGETKAISDANVAILCSGKPIVGENILTRKDGSHIETHFNCAPILDKHGEYAGFVGSVLDISEQKRTEKALFKTEGHFRKLINSTRDGYVIVMGAGKILDANQSYLKMLGYSIDELKALTFLKVTPLKWHDYELNIQGQLLWKRGFTDLYEKEYIRKDGTIFSIEVQAYIIEKGEVFESSKIGAFVRDITKRKFAEKNKSKLESQLRQAEKMQAVGTLAGGIAHNFNNLLGVIIGNTDMIRAEIEKDHRAAAQLDRVLRASRKAKNIIKQILTFSRKSDPKLIPIKLISAVKETLQLFETSKPSSVSINLKFSDVGAYIQADPIEINQIILNLFSNSIYAMNEKGVIDIHLKQVTIDEKSPTKTFSLSPGEYVQLSISDSGNGMDKNTKSRIFEPFFTTKEVGQGTGLGMSMMYSILEKYEGAIDFESEIGQGTTFHFYFPVVQKPPQEIAKMTESALTGDERILLVDDEEMNTQVYGKICRNLGYEVTVKTDSKEALDIFSIKPDMFDLVICDQIMPGLTGEELSKKLLSIKPDIPIILYTGYSTQMDKEKADLQGIKAFALKPLEKEELAKLIRKVLDDL